MTVNRRLLLLVVALAGTLAVVAWVDGKDSELAAPVVRERHVGEGRSARIDAPAPKPARELDLAALNARGLDDMKVDVFAAKSWYVPPPPPPPAKPTAPSVPFTFIGRLIQGDRPAVFVASGDRNQILHVGDVADGAWRVDAIEPNQMKLTYLPLNEAKYFALGVAP